MRYMQCMAQRGGHTIIASIHQPRAAIWAMFDTVSGLRPLVQRAHFVGCLNARLATVGHAK